MAGIARHRWHMVFLVAGGLVLPLMSTPLAACTGVAADPWFRTLLTTDARLLQAGVTVGYSEIGLEVHNRTATPMDHRDHVLGRSHRPDLWAGPLRP